MAGREVVIKIAFAPTTLQQRERGVRKRNPQGLASRRARVKKKRNRANRVEGYECTLTPTGTGTVASCRYLSTGLRRACYVASLAVGWPRANEQKLHRARSSQPVVALFASPGQHSCVRAKKKKGSEDATTVAAGPRADVTATSNGLPTSPRARNSVTVRAVDIADAYSMSDGSSPEGCGRGCRWAGTGGGRWQRSQSRGTGKILDEKNATRIEDDAV